MFIIEKELNSKWTLVTYCVCHVCTGHQMAAACCV